MSLDYDPHKIDTQAIYAEAEALLSAGNAIRESDGPFELRSDGVFFRDQDKNGNPTEMLICSPLKILAETQTAKGENYGRLLEWRDSKDRIHRWAMPSELAHSETNEHIKYLVSRGIEITPTRFSRQKLSEYIASSRPTDTVISTSTLGWNNGLFVLPDLTIGKAREGQSTIYQSASSGDHRFQQSGELEDWNRYISRYCIGNSRLVFSVSIAFAACLLGPLHENGGGFHLRGASSFGKTTALLVAGSVWGGDQRRGFLDTWRTTSNGLESTAELHNDGLLCLDELKECDPKTAGEVAYMLANGQGKGRMSRSVVARRALHWTLLFLSSGELGLADLAEQNGSRIYGGQEVRMCDIPADAGFGMGLFEDIHEFGSAELFARHLTENSKKFYGTPIRTFLQIVTDDLDNIRDSWVGFRKDFMAAAVPEGASGEIQRVAARMALVAFGGSLASGICNWPSNEAPKACKAIFDAWLVGRSGNGNTDAANAVKNVRHFLELHGNSRFQDLSHPESILDPKIQNRAGYKHKNDGETEFMIFAESFRKEVSKGFDPKMVTQELNRRGLLVFDNGRMTKQKKVDGNNQRFYVVSSKIFEEE